MSTDLKAELEALYRALGSGVTSISHNGRTVQYGSAEDIRLRIRTLEARIGNRPKAGFAAFSRGSR